MKKLTRRGFTAAGILAALGASVTVLPGCDVSGCSSSDLFEPPDNEIESVYGPPEYFGLEEDNDTYDPADNELVDVYGPPGWFEGDGEEDGFDPEENEIAGVYGPPPETSVGADAEDAAE